MSIETQQFTTRRCRPRGTGAMLVGVLAMGIIAGCQSGGHESVRLDSVEYPASPVLNQLVGNWSIEGVNTSETGEKIFLTGTATGVVDKAYFLRFDMTIRDPRNGQTVQGTSILGQDGGRRLTLVSTHSSTPNMRMYRGELDAEGTTITMTQIDRPSNDARRLVLRLASKDRWTAEAWSSQAATQPAETLEFRRVP